MYWRSVDILLDRNAKNNTIRKAAADKGSHQKRRTIINRVDKDGKVVGTEAQLRDEFRVNLIGGVQEFGL